MKIGKGVEWAAHACVLLAALPEGRALPGEALAAFLGVPQPYMAKQLQALSRAGVVIAQRGAAGGYRLARPAAEISLWDVTAAVEGEAPSFRCAEVRRNGPCGAAPAECARPCAIAAAFHEAESGYRRALAAAPLTELVANITREASAARKQRIAAWIEQHATKRA
ncbi:MAG: Rrf2 family transcriptional regulator [Pseudomonadota bacterium]